MGKKKEKGGLAYLLGLSGQPSAGLALGVVLAVLAALLEVVPYLAVFCALMGIAGAPLGVGALRGMADLPAAAAVAAASALTSLALGFLSSILCHTYAFRVICGIRKALARHLAKLPVSYCRHTSSGKVVQVFQTDVDQLEGFLAHQLPDLVSTVALLIFLVAGMVAFDWRLALVAVAVLAVGFMGQFVPMIKLLKEGALKKNFDALERISSAATEYVHGMPSIKMFGQTPRSFAGFQTDIEAYRDFSTSMSRRVGTGVVFFRAVVLSVATFVAPVLVAMALTAPDSAELLPTALFFLVFAPAASAPVCKLRSFSEGMNVLGESSARVEAIFRERSLPVFGIRAPHGTEVTFDHVGFAYPAKGGGEPAPVLDDVSFTAPAGQITAIVGPSGSGKSTVASLICRFYDAGAGAVRIGGADLRGMSEGELSELVSFVFQESHVFSMSVRDNIRLARPDATDAEVREAARLARVDGFADALPQGLDTPVGAGGVGLSGGERQRVAIARAFLKDAPVLVLDEATSALDPINEREVQRALSALLAGRAVIMVAHSLASVRGVDEICVMDGGRVVERGAHEELMAAGGLYARLWNLQQQAADWRIA